MRGEMRDLKDFKIKFSGLGLGEHSFDYQLNNQFFELFDYREFQAADLLAKVMLRKKSNGMDLEITVDGTVNVPCDITTDQYDQPINGKTAIVVKFGDVYDDSNEEILVLPMGEHELNVAQYLYETSVLGVPLKRISPEAESGEKGRKIREKLEDLSPERQEEKQTPDPRWDKLKNLLN